MITDTGLKRMNELFKKEAMRIMVEENASLGLAMLNYEIVRK